VYTEANVVKVVQAMMGSHVFFGSLHYLTPLSTHS
jgi:hypothetical protein